LVEIQKYIFPPKSGVEAPGLPQYSACSLGENKRPSLLTNVAAVGKM